METVPQGDKTNCLPHKGHEFIPTLYHFPSNCEACSKPLWHVFKPPPALECRRCHVKCHKDHLDKKEDVIAPCKGKVLSVVVKALNDSKSELKRDFTWATRSFCNLFFHLWSNKYVEIISFFRKANFFFRSFISCIAYIHVS